MAVSQIQETVKTLQQYDLLLNQPNISHADLKIIETPVLMADDRDIIKYQHSVEIFENLSKGELCIMPATTHVAPRDKPEMFNEIVNRFLSEPFESTFNK